MLLSITDIRPKLKNIHLVKPFKKDEFLKKKQYKMPVTVTTKINSNLEQFNLIIPLQKVKNHKNKQNLQQQLQNLQNKICQIFMISKVENYPSFDSVDKNQQHIRFFLSFFINLLNKASYFYSKQYSQIFEFPGTNRIPRENLVNSYFRFFFFFFFFFNFFLSLIQNNYYIYLIQTNRPSPKFIFRTQLKMHNNNQPKK
eukprot:TRINITY_DN43044_c0_g1_i1.p1 TRINITY_DN43044_c0_g1~~TRINITY_DN43044_c0_g1_i1.p1  ORF type:complete len:199 (+),score=6.82 TRINITY_DN43044_c0_g1_i1:635-1231(+)